MAKKQDPLELGSTLLLVDGRQYRCVEASQVRSWLMSRANDYGQAGLESPERRETFKVLMGLCDQWQVDSRAEGAELLKRHRMAEED